MIIQFIFYLQVLMNLNEGAKSFILFWTSEMWIYLEIKHGIVGEF